MRTTLASALLATTVMLPAQDMVGVSWSGTVYGIDSYTPALTTIGPSGLQGHNGMAMDDQCNLWISGRTGTSFYHLDRLDPVSGTATQVFSATPDMRGLTGDGSSRLWAVVNGGDDLYSIDLTTGTFTMVGSIGFSSVQGLALHGGTLYAWDLSAGLLRVDTSTGVGTDVNPGVGSGVAGLSGVQFLTVRSDGTLIAGRDSLYSVDPATGVPTLIGALGTNLDLRGAESIGGVMMPYGVGCNGSYGPVALSGSGQPAPGGTVTTTSTNHETGVLGAIVFGFSNSTHLGLSLPHNLDPLLGTSGCNLYASIDATLIGVTSGTAPTTLSFSFSVPMGVTCFPIYLQHAAFEPQVSGGMSWSNGLEVLTGL